MKIKTKLYALGATALLGIPALRALTVGVKSRRRERVYQDVLKAALADGQRSIFDCEKAAKTAADRI